MRLLAPGVSKPFAGCVERGVALARAASAQDYRPERAAGKDLLEHAPAQRLYLLRVEGSRENLRHRLGEHLVLLCAQGVDAKAKGEQGHQ